MCFKLEGVTRHKNAIFIARELYQNLSPTLRLWTSLYRKKTVQDRTNIYIKIPF